MIADPEGPSFIIRTAGHRRYSGGALVTHNPDPKFTPMPTTWLNGGRWMDDLDDQRDQRGIDFNAV